MKGQAAPMLEQPPRLYLLYAGHSFLHCYGIYNVRQLRGRLEAFVAVRMHSTAYCSV